MSGDSFLTVSGGEKRRGYIDKDSDWCVSHVREGFSAVEDKGNDSRSQVSCEVGADCDARKSPHHVSISEADDEWGRGR